jgi:hypothetical protein
VFLAAATDPPFKPAHDSKAKSAATHMKDIGLRYNLFGNTILARGDQNQAKLLLYKVNRESTLS